MPENQDIAYVILPNNPSSGSHYHLAEEKGMQFGYLLKPFPR